MLPVPLRHHAAQRAQSRRVPQRPFSSIQPSRRLSCPYSKYRRQARIRVGNLITGCFKHIRVKALLLFPLKLPIKRINLPRNLPALSYTKKHTDKPFLGANKKPPEANLLTDGIIPMLFKQNRFKDSPNIPTKPTNACAAYRNALSNPLPPPIFVP
ncbi:hypothetical protein [Neisseria polysaccharea]|uniref:hypothetical protein n=1 Tax=Neisseria polysaccharea TaxID=489 RepID=UPI0027DEEABF|nr:hypothetical protein [Neisseria polysaccharea]